MSDSPSTHATANPHGAQTTFSAHTTTHASTHAPAQPTIITCAIAAALKQIRRALPGVLFLYALATLTSMAAMEAFGWLTFLLIAIVTAGYWHVRFHSPKHLALVEAALQIPPQAPAPAPAAHQTAPALQAPALPALWPPKPALLAGDWALLALMLAILLSAISPVTDPQTYPVANRLAIIGQARFVPLYFGIVSALLLVTAKYKAATPAAPAQQAAASAQPPAPAAQPAQQAQQAAQQIGKVITYLLPVVALIAIYAIYQHFTGHDLIRGARNQLSSVGGGKFRATGTFSFTMTFAHAFQLTFCFPFAITLLAPKNQMLLKVLAIITTALAAVAVIGTYTRGVWLGLTFTVLVMSALTSKRALALTASTLVAVWSGLAALAPEFLSRALSITDLRDASNYTRLDLWMANIRMFLDHPFTGVGYGVNEPLTQTYFQKVGIENSFTGHAHMNALQFLSGTGALGFISYTAFVLIFLYMAYRLLRSFQADKANQNFWPHALALACIGTILALQVSGMTECNFKDMEVNHGYMLSMALLMVLWRAYGLKAALNLSGLSKS